MAVRPRLAPMRRRSLEQVKNAPPFICTFTSAAGTVYNLPAAGQVRRVPYPDQPPVRPTSGEAQVRLRPYHNIVSFKNIENAFAHEIEIDFETDHTGGIITDLAGSTCTTNFKSGIWNAPFENNPSIPTDAGTSTLMPPRSNSASTRPSAMTGPNRNPKHGAVFFRGTTNTGIFTGRTDDIGSNDYDLDVLIWAGTSWAVAHEEFVNGSADETTCILSFAIHKGGLHMAYANASGAIDVATSTTGATWADLMNGPSHAATSRPVMLVDDGSRLYSFADNASGSINVDSTDDDGVTAWDDRGVFRGNLRDVDRFTDRDGNDQIVVLTEDSLYWYDTTNFLPISLLPLPFSGRAMVQWGDELIIFMEGGHVIAYKASGAFRDISPYLGVVGSFGADSNSQVCLTRGARGIYALFDGIDASGSAQKPLCLLWDGMGWHFVWQKADTSVSGAGRFIVIDPVSGDLLMGIQDAISTSDQTVLVQLKDIETDPVDQATLDRNTSGVLTTARSGFGAPVVPTTVWDAFSHSAGADANETIALSYRVDGSAGAYSSIATITADNTLVTLPDNGSTSSAGVNCRDIQFQATLSLNAKTDSMRLIGLDIGYMRSWPIRYVHTVDVLTSVSGRGSPGPDRILTDVATILALNTKGTLAYGGNTYSVIPTIDSSIQETVGNLAGEKRAGTVRVVFLEA